MASISAGRSSVLQSAESRRTDTVDFAQDQRMSHETLVGCTKMLYNVMGRLTGGAPRAR
jgi:hypothetical protein